MTGDYPALTSTFEIVIGPGFDVGAHVHAIGEEIFWGGLSRSTVPSAIGIGGNRNRDRRSSPAGRARSCSCRPASRTPSSNSTGEPVKVFFQSSVPGGHENYFDELMAIMEASQGRPDADVVADLRARYDIEQITALH